MTAIPMPPSLRDPTASAALERVAAGERPGRCEASVAEWLVWREGESRARLILAFLKAMAR